MTKRLIAFSLVLILVVSACAFAFADYYPTVQFDSSSKNKYVKYGKTFKLKVKCSSGSGPFYRVPSVSGGWIWRAGLTVVAKSGSFSKKIADWDFTGNYTVKQKVSTCSFYDPVYGVDKYKLTATSWYKPTIGTLVLDYRKYKSVKTKLYIYR